ncbi:MAG: flagellar biosynthetic protein FliO [Deltaproteobacteria bacterium]|nr:flagellar biosynthetic protein FliO [Deltaproteobacteria bacterium]
MNYQPDLISTAVKMFAALAVLLVFLISALYVSKRVLGRGVPRYSGGMIRILSSIHVGVKKTITMVEVPGAVLVLGVTNDHIRLLTKIEDESLLGQFEVSENQTMPGSFLNHLKSLSTKYKKKTDEI